MIWIVQLREEKSMPSPQRKFTAAELVPGQTYRVRKAFTDYDGIVHRLGETWRFIGKNFLPYEDGLTLHIETRNESRTIRLQWREEAQGGTIDTFSDFVEEI